MTYDFYDLLEVPDDASQDEIKDAFRDKVQEVHPDLNDDPRAPAQFTALKKGYDTLKDPVERKAYDRLGHTDYVAKRLEGLPSADQWKPADSGGSASGGSGTASSASTGSSGASSESSSGASSESSSGASSGTAGSTSSGGASTRTTSATGTTGAGGATGTTGASTGSATGGTGGTSGDSTASTNTTTPTGTGTRTGGTTASSTRTGTTSASGTGTASDAAAGSSGTSDGSTSSSTAGPGLVERLRSINYGWPLVFLTTLVYAVGVGMYARENLGALQELVAQVRASGTDAAALREALLAADYGLATVFEFVRTTALVGSAPGPGVLIAIGAVLMPAIFFVVVRTTRQAFAWQPTYLYVAAVLAPLAGLGANAGGVDRPVLTVVAFGLLPLGAVVALLFNAWVTPRLKRLL